MNDYLTIDGQKYRVECNWNAHVAFLEATGRDQMASLVSLAEIKPSETTALMASCINEGERMDGKKTNLTPIELGAKIGLVEVGEFMRIYHKQTTPAVPVEKAKKKKS